VAGNFPLFVGYPATESDVKYGTSLRFADNRGEQAQNDLANNSAATRLAHLCKRQEN